MLVVAIAEPKVVLCLEGADARGTYIVVYRCRPCPWCPLQEPIFSAMHNDAMDIVVARAANSPVGEGADPAWVHKPPYPTGFHGAEREESEKKRGEEMKKGWRKKKRDGAPLNINLHPPLCQNVCGVVLGCMVGAGENFHEVF